MHKKPEQLNTHNIQILPWSGGLRDYVMESIYNMGPGIVIQYLWWGPIYIDITTSEDGGP